MKLKANPPTRVPKTVVNDLLGVFLHRWTIQGLEDEGAEIEMLEIGGSEADLGVDELQFIAQMHHEGRIGLGADADPIHTFRDWDGTVAFDGHLESNLVKGIDESGIQLQKRLSACADDQWGTSTARPKAMSQGRQFPGRLVPPTQGTIGAVEIGIAPPGAPTAPTTTIFFSARPE